jgi:thioredoxin reductase
MKTVDVVITGADAAAMEATLDAVRNGRHVLVVIRSRRAGIVQQLRRSLRALRLAPAPRVMVMTGAEVACVDGVGGVEAVVVRNLRSGRLSGFNTQEVLCFPN